MKSLTKTDLFVLCVLVAGIPPDKLVEAHGTFASATCTVCRRSYSGEDFRVSPSIADNSTPGIVQVLHISFLMQMYSQPASVDSTPPER